MNSDQVFRQLKLILQDNFYSDMICTIFYNILHFRKLTFSWLYIDKKCRCPYIKSLIPEFLDLVIDTINW